MNKSFSISWVLSVLLVTSVGLMSAANTSKAAIAILRYPVTFTLLRKLSLYLAK